jgi:surface carbohydrate biosynthesis protein
MKSGTIALVVDNPFRDLPGLILTGMQLCQAGYTCYLVPLNLRDWEIWSLAPDFVLLNYLKKNNQDFARCAMDAGMRVGILDTEGGIFTSLDAYGVEIAPDNEVRSRIECFCSWGPKLADYITENGWFSDQQITVTGCPRFDFYAAPWRTASLEASRYADDYGRPLVLISGIFTLANPAFEDPEEEARGVAAFLGRPVEEVFEWQRIEREAMLAHVDLCNQLAARFPNVSFVYRPHPFEKLSTYTGLFAERDNLHVVKKGTVDGWILRASALIQRGCSTATEASMIGVPVLSPKWIPGRGFMEAPESVSIQCDTFDHLASNLEEIVAGRLDIPTAIQDTIQQVTADWFLSIDGESHRRVANAIAGGMTGSSDVSLKYCARAIDGVTYRNVAVGRRMRSLARRALGRSVHWSFSRFENVFHDDGWVRSDKYFGLEEVQSIADSIQPLAQNRSEGAWANVTVRPASDVGSYRFGYLHGRAVALTLA